MEARPGAIGLIITVSYNRDNLPAMRSGPWFGLRILRTQSKMTSRDLTAEAFPISDAPPTRAFPADFAWPAAFRRRIWMFLGALLALRLIAMAGLPLVDTTEARYAEIARKMVETGNWLTPQFDYGLPFWGKPPLHTWISALGMEAFGVSAFAARLPLLAVSLAILALVHGWAARVFGTNRALAATAILSSMGLFWGASGFVMTDMPMVLGLVLAMVGFWRATQEESSSRLWGHAVFLGLAMGLMAKGPVALALLLVALAPWLAIRWLGRGAWGDLRRLPWASGTLLLILLVAPWHLAAEAATPGFLRYFLWGEHVQRFLVPGWSGDLYGSAHLQPKGAIWPMALMIALPWSLLAPLLILRRRSWGAAGLAAAPSGFNLYLLCWSLAAPIFFTLAGNILPAYALSALPAAAILMAAAPSADLPQSLLRGLKVLGAALIGIAALATLLVSVAPEALRLKSQERLAEAARPWLREEPLYVLGRRSFSAEFYTAGRARSVSLEDLPALAAGSRPVALSAPLESAAQVAAEGFHPVGGFGRYGLFVSGDAP